MNYDELEQATIEWAATRPDIRAVLAIGSRARREQPADQWSDLDLIMLSTEPAPYADPAWLEELGEVWVTLVEEANPGDPDVQVIFAGGAKGDFTFVRIVDPERPLETLLDELSYQNVLARGGRIIFDRLGSPRPLPTRALRPHVAPSEEQYLRLVNGFWLYAVRVAKFARRGDLWRASLNHVFRINTRILTLMEWHAQASAGRDTWYDGRFMQTWADPRALAALPAAFPQYEAADLRRALLEAISLFRLLAQETAALLGYTYPAEIDQNISRLIDEI